MTRAVRIIVLLVCIACSSSSICAKEIIRISAVSLKNFSDAKANDSPRLRFIADRIAEQAVKGVCVVDEVQDADGSAMKTLHDAVAVSAGRKIEMALSQRVGGNQREPSGLYG